MKNSENLRKLLHAMDGFRLSYLCLLNEIVTYEQDTGAIADDIPGFNEYYPFHKSFDDLAVENWVTNTIAKVRESAFKILDYEYLNTGGNTMVGIFTVWIPSLKQTVYAFTNEEGCTLSVVDYVRNDIDIHDYDELTIDQCNFDDLQSSSAYFELYRHCLSEYTKSDCRYFGGERAIRYELLSDELQRDVHVDYLVWCEENNNGCIPTDGEKIIVCHDYDMLFTDPHEDDEDLQAVKAWKAWHDKLINDSTIDEVNDLYDKKYRLTFNGKRVFIPFNADTYSLIDDLLTSTIREW